MSKGPSVKIAYITTIPVTQWSFLNGQNNHMKSMGFELHAISSPGPELEQLVERDGVIAHPLFISRTISPLRDLRTLFFLYLTLRRIRPTIAHVSTPKAALLGSIAAWLARVPVRIYLIRGLITERSQGAKRSLFLWLERLTAWLCHSSICVAPSLLEFARAEGILGPRQGLVLANGMSNGIDPNRFDPTAVEPAHFSLSDRGHAHVPKPTEIIGFVGRLARDKGIEEIDGAWTLLRDEFPNVVLLLVGPWEEEDRVSAAVRRRMESDARVVLVGHVADVVTFYRAMDLFVFPSHGTEGFPNAPMEAACMGLPVIATAVVGCIDAVVNDITGTLVPPRDAAALAMAIRRYLRDPELRQRHGLAGRKRVLREFRPEAIWDALYQAYVRLLREKGLPIPETPPQNPVSADTVDTRPTLTISGSLGETRLTQKDLVQFTTRAIKRLIDLVTAPIALILLAPVIALIAGAIRLTMGRPVFFQQLRPGYRMKPFVLYKFRTMSEAYNAEGTPRPDAERLTRLGRLLRHTSLDELPQLWNVLRGDLSLVGPRPLLMQYLPLYTPEQAKRHDVRPGITGWAQVHGRNAISWQDKFSYDVWYVEHWSLWLDLKILILTLIKVSRQTGISQAGHATMQEFTGTTGRP